MILKSIIDEKEFFWIKIPRTATYSFKGIFKKYNSIEEKHFHESYENLCSKFNKQLYGVSVVRHPLHRFVSVIQYLANRYTDTTSDAKNLWYSTERCVSFLNDTFRRNCQPVADIQSIFLDSDTTKPLPIQSPIGAFFKTQTEYAYHPKVKTFYYENLTEFVGWIHGNLGYDVNTVPKINSSHKNTDINVNFDDPDFIKTVENLFYIDYKVFGYPLQYLK